MSTEQTTPAQDQSHTDVVAQAAVDVFNTTCGVSLEPLSEENLAADGIIMAVISLVGDVEWSVFLGLPRQTATAAAAQFAGFEIPFDSPDMGDAVGEMTNMLAGQVKMLLDQRSVRAEISLPSVLRAENMSVLVQRSVESYKTCFGSSLGKLWTGVTIGHAHGLVA
jgi:chemotaxis protein CheX